jgi:drug/metabolite transporter (DMT)-like permease
MKRDPAVPTRILFSLLAGDLLLVALHVATRGAAVVDLDAEGNIPTWVSSAKLLAIAVLAYLAWQREAQDPTLKYRWLWLGVALLFAAMSLDETASLHERAARALVSHGPARNLRATILGGDASKDSFAWVVLFAPLALAAIFFLVGFGWTRRHRLRRVAVLAIAGLGCYVGAMVLEPAAVYFSPAMATWDAAAPRCCC